MNIVCVIIRVCGQKTNVESPGTTHCFSLRAVHNLIYLATAISRLGKEHLLGIHFLGLLLECEVSVYGHENRA